MFNKNRLSSSSFAHQRAWISPSLMSLRESIFIMAEQKLPRITNSLRTVNYRSKAWEKKRRRKPPDCKYKSNVLASQWHHVFVRIDEQQMSWDLWKHLQQSLESEKNNMINFLFLVCSELSLWIVFQRSSLSFHHYFMKFGKISFTVPGYCYR